MTSNLNITRFGNLKHVRNSYSGDLYPRAEEDTALWEHFASDLGRDKDCLLASRPFAFWRVEDVHWGDIEKWASKPCKKPVGNVLTASLGFWKPVSSSYLRSGTSCWICLELELLVETGSENNRPRKKWRVTKRSSTHGITSLNTTESLLGWRSGRCVQHGCGWPHRPCGVKVRTHTRIRRALKRALN